MNLDQFNSQFFDFLRNSPTPFHVVQTSVDLLQKSGFQRLSETADWHIEQGCGYYVVREQAALIAFICGSQETPTDGFRILSGHTDSPSLQIKPKGIYQTGNLQQLGVEVYGGSLLAPWFDRDLSIAGRVCCEDNAGKLHMLLLRFTRPMLFIPSVAIHFDREANKNRSINAQKDLAPVISQVIGDQLPDISELILQQCCMEHPELALSRLLGFDLFCHDTAEPIFTGINGEFISAGRLDNQVSCFAGLMALAGCDKTRNSLLFLANHEEIGSNSSTGAQGAFLDSVFARILGQGQEKYRCMSNSFFISMDNAHASHPNCSEKMEPRHEIQLNGGPVIKYNSNQRYTTYSMSSSVFKKICEAEQIPFQEFVMRSDLPCGSTIGPSTAANLGLKALDIGVPSLAMHSIREHTGASDPFHLFLAARAFCRSDMHHNIFQS